MTGLEKADQDREDFTDELSDEALDRDEARSNSHASLPWGPAD
jgi:hypothetical protein